ncbi:cysteine/serine-rich nuclear protein 2-like isoform X3 [Pseudopipra pipra]|uniref:cysteine/serine-rich nuclear protein 2-like isoform X3 n=1 Tax=Pseudopipra pipra TaxID=415032 RepID=UPI00313A1F08
MAALPRAGTKRRLHDAEPGPAGSSLGSAGSALGSAGSLSGSSGSSLGSAGSPSDDEVTASDSGDSCDSGGSASARPPSILCRSRPRRAGKRVRFAQVTVFYFARRQGFTCVPSAGGSSLGMAPRHHRARRYSLSQFAHLRQVSRRQHLRRHLRRERMRGRRRQVSQAGAVPEAGGLPLAEVSEAELEAGQVEVGDCFYLQPLPTKRRRALLRASGVRRIDAEERQELRALRLSREQCGCLCRLTCEPRTCACSQAGIQCQVDRSSFPCGCSRDGCGNASGRIEFNPLRVRTHFLHTLMKLQLQSRREEEEEEEDGGEEAAPGPPWGPPQPPETQDFQEYLAENARAVLHLQTAEELERRRKDEEEEAGAGGRGEGGGGLCVLGEHLDGTAWQVRPPPGPAPGLGPAPFPPGAPGLGFPAEQPVQGGGPVMLPSEPPGPYLAVEPQAGGTGGNGPEEPPAPTCSPRGKDLGVSPVPTAESEGGAPQTPPEHLELPPLPV